MTSLFDTPSRRYGKFAKHRLTTKGYPEYDDSQPRAKDGQWGGGGGSSGGGSKPTHTRPSVARHAGFAAALGAAGATGAGLGSAIARTGLKVGLRNAAIAAPLAVLVGGASYAWARSGASGPSDDVREKKMVDRFRSLANVAGAAGLVGLGGLLFLASRGRLRPDAAVRFAAAARTAGGGASSAARAAKPGVVERAVGAAERVALRNSRAFRAANANHEAALRATMRRNRRTFGDF